MGLFGGAGGAFKKFGKQFTQNARNSGSTFQAIGTYGAAPISIMAGSVGAGLQAVRPVLQQASQIAAENPALLGAAGAALGMPGLGGLFGGGGADPGMAAGGTFTGPTAPSNSTPMWEWLAAAGAAVLALVLILRRKPA